jgi:hypothetical protein
MHPSRLLSLASIVLILAGAYLYAYPEVSSYFSHTLHVTSPSLNVQGIYYVLPLSGVDSVSLDSGELKVKGYYAPMSRFVGPREIRRKVPEGMIAANVIPDSLPVWRESDMIVRNLDERPLEWKRTFINTRTGARFSYGDPFNSAYGIGRTYHGEGDTTVVVFAFGKMNQDTKIWMGYVMITSRVGP